MSGTTKRQLAALTALVVGPATLVLAVVVAARNFPRGLSVLACLGAAAAAAWFGVRRRGVARAAGLGAATLLVGGAITVVVVEGSLLENLLVVAGICITLAAATAAFATHVALPRATPPRHPVLFMNPKSGGGRAERFHLADEARARGIEPIELQRGDDLWKLVRDAVADGADALAMAGGDGSQAIVAAVAAERGVPYACIPAGTRNHFALDLGVDRDDVVGALDAFVDGGEQVVDLATVNGRVFVNNVSLGLYAEAVQKAGYRDAKVRTLLDTAPDALGPNGAGGALRWRGPDGERHHSGAALLVSNNRYRLGRLLGSGTRPRMDQHVLGIAVVDPAAGGRPLTQWSRPSFQVDSDRPVAAGIDGEAAMLEAPVRFDVVPAALRVRIAPAHPGASPSAGEPDSLWEGVRTLASVAVRRAHDQPTGGQHGAARAEGEDHALTGGGGDAPARDR